MVLFGRFSQSRPPYDFEFLDQRRGRLNREGLAQPDREVWLRMKQLSELLALLRQSRKRKRFEKSLP